MLAMVAWDLTIRVRIITVFNIKYRDEPKIDRGETLNISKKLKTLDRGLYRIYQVIWGDLIEV